MVPEGDPRLDGLRRIGPTRLLRASAAGCSIVGAWLMPLRWQPRTDGRTAVERGLDLQLSAEQRYTLVHPEQPEPLALSLRVEAAAVVANEQLHLARLLADSTTAREALPCLVAFVSASWMMR